MAINFVTGLPRQGKTLWTIVHVKERAEKENRPVYYCNIPEVTIEGWKEIKHPNEWLNIENDAIILVDELQDFWGKESSGARVPEPILELSKHGKRGVEFYFITQDPALVHMTPRKLCETHYHVVRAFGTQMAAVNKFRGMQDNPSKSRQQAEKIIFRYPTEVFGKRDAAGNWIKKPWYKSADVHNVKRRIPWQVWAIPAAIIAVVVFGVTGYLMFTGVLDRVKNQDKTGGLGGSSSVSGSVPNTASPPSSASSANTAEEVRGPLTPEQYQQTFIPRVEGFPESAPRYDGVTRPVTAPYLAACIQMGRRCECYSQQGTRLHGVSPEICANVVREGLFIDWDTARGRDGTRRNHSSSHPDNTPAQRRESASYTGVVNIRTPPVGQVISNADLLNLARNGYLPTREALPPLNLGAER